MNVAILGLGLIGGSIGLGLRAGGQAQPAKAHVVGFDPDRRALEGAVEVGAIDEAAGDLARAVADAEIVFAATPIGVLAPTVRSALRCAPSSCIVSDVGSTKRMLLAELQGEAGVERFVGGHPLAGSEQGGVEHARPDLFVGSAWCLSPLAKAPVPQRLASLIAGLGAHAVEIDAEAHDRLMARISHLPHVLANVLVEATSGSAERELGLAAAGPSFRDATRVAGASSAIWTDIYTSNADELDAAIGETIAALEQVQAALQARDAGALAAWNEDARAARDALAGATLPRAAEGSEPAGAG